MIEKKLILEENFEEANNPIAKIMSYGEEVIDFYALKKEDGILDSYEAIIVLTKEYRNS